MANSPMDSNDDFLKGASVPWWQSLRFRWLLAAPMLALPVLLVIQGPLQKVSGGVRATWQLEKALQAARDDDPALALEKVNGAIETWPMSEQLYLVRAAIRRNLGDLRGSLDDYDIAIHLVPTFPDAYLQRAQVRRLLGFSRDALEDIDMAVALMPRDEPEPLNLRAYFRALEGVKLEEALDDIQRAISMEDEAPAALLDTRACVFLGLGELDNALRDANDAIRLTEKERQQMLDSKQFANATEEIQELSRTRKDEVLSVLYYHRSQIYAALGDPQLAQQDADQADSLGFRPEIE